jgi:hypothetical protein
MTRVVFGRFVARGLLSSLIYNERILDDIFFYIENVAAERVLMFNLEYRTAIHKMYLYLRIATPDLFETNFKRIFGKVVTAYKASITAAPVAIVQRTAFRSPATFRMPPYSRPVDSLYNTMQLFGDSEKAVFDYEKCRKDAMRARQRVAYRCDLTVKDLVMNNLC